MLSLWQQTGPVKDPWTYSAKFSLLLQVSGEGPIRVT